MRSRQRRRPGMGRTKPHGRSGTDRIDQQPLFAFPCPDKMSTCLTIPSNASLTKARAPLPLALSCSKRICRRIRWIRDLPERLMIVPSSASLAAFFLRSLPTRGGGLRRQAVPLSRSRSCVSQIHQDRAPPANDGRDGSEQCRRACRRRSRERIPKAPLHYAQGVYGDDSLSSRRNPKNVKKRAIHASGISAPTP